MDTLTHALSGALLARATAPGTPRPGQASVRAWVGAGFVAAAFPDIDIISAWFGPMAYLTHHRGVTHSLLLVPLWAFLLALLFAALSRGHYHWRAFFGVSALALAIHIAGDLITSYGTMILAPFSDVRPALYTTFIIDPYFSGIIVIGLLASWLVPATRMPAVLGMVVLVGYVGWQATLRGEALEWGRAYADGQRLERGQVHAVPQPLSPFNWKLIVRDDGDYHLTRINLRATQVPVPPGEGLFAALRGAYQPPAAAVWTVRPRFGADAPQAAVARDAWQAEELADFRWFAAFPAVHRIEQRESGLCVWFADLRFDLPYRGPVFVFGGCRADIPDSPWRLFRMGRDGRIAPVDG